uniref:Fork-head domain-containing protein n=1 Tax=Elaeophora elaphi TaxID=1147741 RepID=A0A0R3RVY5_9BILA
MNIEDLTLDEDLYTSSGTLGGIPAANSSNTEPLSSPTTSSPSRSSETSTVDTVASSCLLRPYHKSDSAIPIPSAFSARTINNPDQLQSPGIPVTAFSPLLTPAMMAAQIGLLSTPNTLLSMMQVYFLQETPFCLFIKHLPTLFIKLNIKQIKH